MCNKKDDIIYCLICDKCENNEFVCNSGTNGFMVAAENQKL